jgi:mannose-6-phosphate isomerase-like protein (cupin superfamily)
MTTVNPAGPNEMIETVQCDGRVLAILIRRDFSAEGIHFFTPDSFSQQLAYMRHPAGHVIKPHVHNPVDRRVDLTNEVLFVRSGAVRVDFYDDEKNYLESRTLLAGDVILLAGGGHGFTMLDEAEMIEVKQGPYAGEADKTRFEPVGEDLVRLREPPQ